MTKADLLDLAGRGGFDLAGIAAAAPVDDFKRYSHWVDAGQASGMTYLTDHRGAIRADPRHLLESARSILCVGLLYNSPDPYSTSLEDTSRGWISRYAWGHDYHDVMRERLEALVARMRREITEPFEARICVDTAPLLERSYARAAGLGWIGKNTCLINEETGSWYFLGEVLLSLAFEPDSPQPDRCGTCTRCIDACPTAAIVPDAGEWVLDSRLCISYHTIESREASPPALRGAFGTHVFGCDICQDVCPWNSGARVATTADAAFQPAVFAPPLEDLAALSEEQFRARFRHTPVWRARYAGFLRNVALAMGNSGREEHRAALERFAGYQDQAVADTAKWVLAQLK